MTTQSAHSRQSRCRSAGPEPSPWPGQRELGVTEGQRALGLSFRGKDSFSGPLVFRQVQPSLCVQDAAAPSEKLPTQMSLSLRCMPGMNCGQAALGIRVFHSLTVPFHLPYLPPAIDGHRHEPL